jgi:transcriptional regulator with XRE-family HTH domain
MNTFDHRTVALAFGVVLKAQRHSVAISQEQLAERADLDRTTPSLYERGLRQPTISTLIAIGSALGCDPCSLLCMTIARLTAARP